jgi:preprotein translocase subunit Sec63
LFGPRQELAMQFSKFYLINNSISKIILPMVYKISKINSCFKNSKKETRRLDDKVNFIKKGKREVKRKNSQEFTGKG